MTVSALKSSNISFGQAILDEVLEQIANDITSYGKVEDNALLKIASTHGSGYLAGTAAALLDVAAQTTGAERETNLITSAIFSILTVIQDRHDDAALLDEAGYPPAPSTDTQGAQLSDSLDFDPTTCFDELLKRIGAAPTLFARAA